LSSINGIDTLVLNTIRAKTEKSTVTGTERAKVTGDKNKEDNPSNNFQRRSKNLKAAVKKLNKLLKSHKAPFLFQFVNTENSFTIQVVDLENNIIFAQVPPEKVFNLLDKLNDISKGFTIDRLI